jgi:leader peptidase (prepilin peptidase)/N-methyltransferase
MVLTEVFSAYSWLWVVVVSLISLLIGSFLNVVIHRLPIMMEKDWMAQCAELNGNKVENNSTFNLSTPRSACPHCGHAITAFENIPILSYVFLKGRCGGCQTHISLRYPIVEALTAILSVFVAYHFGFGWETVGALMLTWILIALTFIDLDHQLLPDKLTLSLLWLGLIFNLFSTYASLNDAVLGAIIGYLSLWSIYHLFRLITGKEGMGYGDFKLLGALGAWLGWQALPLIVLLSSFVGAFVGIALILFKQHGRDIPIPFGPYLAAAGWITLLWGDMLTQSYFKMAGLA